MTSSSMILGPTSIVRRKLPLGPEAPTHARRLLDPLLLAAATREKVALLVSELVTNAVLHSQAPEGARVTVTVASQGDWVGAEIGDPGPGFEWEPEDIDPMEPGGLGLVLVDRLADRWGIRRKAGSCVWFECQAAGAR